MGFRDGLREFVKSRAEGRVTFDSSGGSTYHPPGARVRYVGDWLAVVGAMAYLLSTFGAYSLVTVGTTGYPELYPGIHPRLNLAAFAAGPLVGALVVWASVLLGGWRSRLVVVLVGGLGTALTRTWLAQLVAWATGGDTLPPAFVLAGLSAGSAVILVGGVLGASAAYFGAWATRLDA